MMSSHGNSIVHDLSRIAPAISDIIRAQAFAICRRYKRAEDLDVSRSGRAFNLACGGVPNRRRGPCAGPRVSRLADAPSLKDVIRLFDALVYTGLHSMQRPHPCCGFGA